MGDDNPLLCSRQPGSYLEEPVFRHGVMIIFLVIPNCLYKTNNVGHLAGRLAKVGVIGKVRRCMLMVFWLVL